MAHGFVPGPLCGSARDAIRFSKTSARRCLAKRRQALAELSTHLALAELSTQSSVPVFLQVLKWPRPLCWMQSTPHAVAVPLLGTSGA